MMGFFVLSICRIRSIKNIVLGHSVGLCFNVDQFVEAVIANRAVSFQRSAEFQIILQLLKRIYYFL